MNTQLPNSRRLRSQSNLPPSVTLLDEVIAEILSWLPVRTLMQIKCVSKSWNTIISDPKFIKMHLNRSARNPHFSLVSYKTPTFDDDDHRFIPFPAGHLLDNRHITFPKDPYYLLHDKDCREVIGSCNGLVCLLGYSSAAVNTYTYRQVIWLRFWNPATRKISDRLGSFDDFDYGSNSWRFVFCYDNSTDYYKVVALHYNGNVNSPVVEVSIFTLGDNVWRTIQTLSFVPLQLLYSYWRMYDGVQFNCTVNWLARNRIPGTETYTVDWLAPNTTIIYEFVIISLHIGTETYTKLMLPPSADKSTHLSSVCVLMNSFCFSQDFNGTDFVIWKMTEFGDDRSWTQLFTFSYHNLRMNLNSRVVYSRLKLKPLHLSEDGDTIVFGSCLDNQAILYNLRTNRVLKSRVNKKICWFSIKDYVESLVSTY
ncbi:putative F-box domain-containing protein [Medicago truncatula]|uniref:F-box protein interaction domain protein n=1 Tax=Medicago truncatula TaxID=3880 RepID=G7KUT7_MEDTR|nr:F-box/kelch-repeat protein At3g06240 [Medicago truncatula]AES77984.2 F-box protein interaction domain protein [Medicago truncatula]RHN44722.1 putative F-box domain-containing protein [Medicago truncatula]